MGAATTMQSVTANGPRTGVVRAPRDARPRERLLAGHVGRATAVAFSPDGELVATGGEDGTVRIWRSRQGTVIRSIRAHRQAVTAVQFSHDREQVFSAGADRALKVWKVDDGRLVRELGSLLRGHRRSISSLCLSPDGFELLTGAADNTVKLWELPGGGLRRSFKKVHRSKVLTALFSRDGTVLATGGDSGEVRLIDHRPDTLIERDGDLPKLEPLAGLAEISGLAFSPDNTLIAAAGRVASGLEDDASAPQRAFGVWRRGDGKLFKDFPGTHGSGVCFSPDGRYLAAADAYDASQVLRLVDGLVVATYATARFIAFSPDGDLVAVGGEDDLVRLHVFDPLH
jgi:WD40 repeat protein